MTHTPGESDRRMKRSCPERQRQSTEVVLQGLAVTWGLDSGSLVLLTEALAGRVWPAVPASCLSVLGRTWRGKTGRGHCSPGTLYPWLLTQSLPKAYPCPSGLLLTGTGVPSDLGVLGSEGSSSCCGAMPLSPRGGLGGSSCLSKVGAWRKEGLERRWEELRESRTRLRDMETSSRDTGSRA